MNEARAEVFRALKFMNQKSREGPFLVTDLKNHLKNKTKGKKMLSEEDIDQVLELFSIQGKISFTEDRTRIAL